VTYTEKPHARQVYFARDKMKLLGISGKR
jgi:hypothetical protein